MKKALVALSVLLVASLVTIVVLVRESYTMKEEVDKLSEQAKYSSIGIEYLSEVVCSDEIILEYFINDSVRAVKKNDFVWWDELWSEEKKNIFADAMSIMVPEVNYEKETILYSVGRKIVCMQKYLTDLHLGGMQGVEKSEDDPIIYVGVATFSEEYYENQVFFYKINRPKGREVGNVFFSSIIRSPFYIQTEDGDEFIANSLTIQNWDSINVIEGQ